MKKLSDEEKKWLEKIVQKSDLLKKTKATERTEVENTTAKYGGKQMGMIANYQSTTDIELEKFMCLDDVEEAQDDENLEICDIDKMWDALHFLLTGKSALEPIKDNLISEAIVGQFNISGEEIEEFISGTKSDRVKEIAKALQELDFKTYIDKFDMSVFRQNDIYPDIWEYEEEADEIKDDLRTSFESLKKFYEKMAEQERAVLVSIY